MGMHQTVKVFTSSGEELHVISQKPGNDVWETVVTVVYSNRGVCKECGKELDSELFKHYCDACGKQALMAYCGA